MRNKDYVALITACATSHNAYWDTEKPRLRLFQNAYATQFWKGHKVLDSSIRVEVAEGYSFVESTIGSLFTRNPAVEVGKDPVNPDANNELAEELVNRFLVTKRDSIEQASRLALIFPCSFLKLAPVESRSIYGLVTVRAIEPWDILVDLDAGSWDEQRFMGHRYWLPAVEAQEKFGAHDYTYCTKKEFLDDAKLVAKMPELPEEFQYIEVVEFYDLQNDKLVFWSPNYASGSKLLDTPIAIPLRDAEGRPLTNIVPLYFSRQPTRPLEGYSSLATIYDQIKEKNMMRTHWANAVRRDSRQFLVDKRLPEDQLVAITAGLDGAMITVDVQSGENLSGFIHEIPVTPMSSNFERYQEQIESDIQRGSLQGAFTRGEATNSTATEIMTIQSYTASGLGRMARERDHAIEQLALRYIRTLYYLCEDTEEVVVVDGQPVILTPESLDAQFQYTASDAASTPISDMMTQQTLQQLAPVLVQLGADPQVVLKEIVRAFRLPQSLAVMKEVEAPSGASLPGVPNATL